MNIKFRFIEKASRYKSISPSVRLHPITGKTLIERSLKLLHRSLTKINRTITIYLHIGQK